MKSVDVTLCSLVSRHKRCWSTSCIKFLGGYGGRNILRNLSIYLSNYTLF